MGSSSLFARIQMARRALTAALVFTSVFLNTPPCPESKKSTLILGIRIPTNSMRFEIGLERGTINHWKMCADTASDCLNGV